MYNWFMKIESAAEKLSGAISDFTKALEASDVEPFKPEFRVYDDEEVVYWPIEFAADFTGLSRKRLQQLVREERIRGVQPGGRDLFVSPHDLVDYFYQGRMKPGPKPGAKFRNQSS